MKVSQESAPYYYEIVSEIALETHLGFKEKIFKLFAVIDELFQELTREEPIFFSNFFSRCVFVFNKYTVVEDIFEEVHGLRKLRNKINYDPNIFPSESEYFGSIRAACFAIQHFSSLKMPPPLEEICSNSLCVPLRKKPSAEAGEQIPFIEGIVLNTARKETERERQGSKITTYLHCDTEEMGRITVACLGLLNEIDTLVWPNAPIHLFNIIQVPKRESFFWTTQETMIVVDPDYFIDVTEIAECFQRDSTNPLLYLLKKFMAGTSSEKMILGNIVNQFFDHFMRKDEEVDFEIIYEKAFQQQTLLLSFLEDLDCDRLKKNARTHFDSLLPVIKQVKGGLANIGRQTIVIEPTFMSEKYGIQGRLDALLQYDDDKQKDVIELKSGKCPSPGISITVDGLKHYVGMWHNNYAQSSCYNLLLDSTFPGRKGTSSILYSQARSSPLRSANNIPEHKRDVLIVRNKIVAIEHQLANSDVELVKRINPEQFGPVPPFSKEQVAYFDKVLNSASSLEKSYFFTFLSFIAREQRMAKVGTNPEGNDCFASLWRNSMEEKRESFSILSHLEFEKFHFDENRAKESDILKWQMQPAGEKPSGLIFKRTQKTLPVTTFRKGDIAILYPMEVDGCSTPLRHEVFRCTIKELEKDYVKVKLRGDQVEEEYFKESQHWALERDMLDSGYRSMHQSLFDFLAAKPEKRQLLLGMRRPEFAPLDLEKPENMNAEQHQLLTKALSAKDYFLLQGPPGTGKTKVLLSNLVRYLYDHTKENILLLAFTNRAVDEICGAMKKALPENSFLRLGGKESTTHPDCLLSEKVENFTVQQVGELVQKTRVFVSTVASFQHNRQLSARKQFSTAIIDEASQLLEPHLVGLLTQVQRFILIGDEKQLPAVVIQPEKDRRVQDAGLNDIGIHDLSISLFERLLKRAQQQGWKDCYGMLSYQGRMHDHIAQFPNEKFYDSKLNRLEDWQKEENHKFSVHSDNPIVRLLAKSRLLFIASNSEKGKKQNIGEAHRVGKLIQTIKDVYGENFYNKEEKCVVGVIAPYRAQVAEILNKLPESCRVIVDTVERFQGGEHDIIIISFAVNHAKQLRNLEALTADGKVDRKLNVAMTRARQHLIILGCPEIFEQGKYTGELLAQIKNQGGYIGREYLFNFDQQNPSEPA